MKFKTRCLSIILSVAMVLSMTPAVAQASVFSWLATNNSSGDLELGLSKGYKIDNTDYSVKTVKTYSVAPDVVEYSMTTNTSDGNSQTVANVMELTNAGGNATAAVSYGDIEAPIDYTLSSLTSQCKLWEDVTNENVVGGVNGSWHNMGTGKPTGMTVIRGTQVDSSTSYPYFATYSDGSYSIEKKGTSKSTAESNQSKKQGETVTMTGACAGASIMVDDSKVTNDYKTNNANEYPRTAIGIKKDGTLVYFQSDGLQTPRSVGYYLDEEAEMLKALGCEIALQLDEGGSSTFVSQREGEETVSTRNTPTDGAERAVALCILAVSTVKETGVFDHASVTPDEEYYTPNSTVTLTATGIDESGAEAKALPDDISWELKNTGMGELEEKSTKGNTTTAEFTAAKGKTGSVEIDLESDGKVVGAATIYIEDPDELYFASNDISLNYGNSSDLGLTAKYQDEDLHMKDGDIDWELTYEDDYDYENYPIGSFDGLIFTATSDVTVSCTATVTATYATNQKLTDSASLLVGKEPEIIMDGGDEDGLEYDLGEGRDVLVADVDNIDNEGVKAVGKKVGIFSYAGRGGKVSAEIVDDTEEDYADVVRFGNHAVRIDYDWTGITGIDGACLGPATYIDITGSPTAVGAWIYIPDNTTPLPWVRMEIATSKDNGNTWNSNYVNFIDYNVSGSDVKISAIDGSELTVGWNYIEADLTSYLQNGTQVRINPAMLFRCMVKTDSATGWYTVDKKQLSQADLKGYLLVDNVCFVYGANNQDTTAPEVTSLSILDEDDQSLTEIKDGMTVDENTLSFYAAYDDKEETDPFATGVDTAYFLIDGVNMGEGINESSLGHSTLENITLSNGDHSITFYVKDGYGNITRETRTFTVKGKEDYPSITMKPEGDPYVGKDWHLSLTASDCETITSANATLTISSAYPVDADQVAFPKGVTGNATYKASKGTLNIEITDIDASKMDGTTLVDIPVSISRDVVKGSAINVQVSSGEFNTTLQTLDGDDNWAGTFSTTQKSYTIQADYLITADALVQGYEGVLTITDEKGNPSAGVSIYMENNPVDDETSDEVEDEASDEVNDETSVEPVDDSNLVLLGVSDDDGIVVVEDALTSSTGSYVLYADDGKGNYSYKTTVHCYTPADVDKGWPYFISNTTSSDEATEQSITWMSSYKYAASSAQIEYGTNADLSDAVTASGTSKALSFSQDGVVARSNRVQLSGLSPSTTYYYRVGDGTEENWSDIETFSTGASDPDTTNLFLIADIQEDDAVTGFTQIADVIQSSDKDYDFGVQLGDTVEQATSYEQWMSALDLFTMKQYADTDWLHVLGNHDIDDINYGDTNGKAIYGVDSDYYSLEYGDVYIAVLNYTQSSADLNAFGEWLVEDAANSDCTWKLVMTHVPVYYTNTTASETGVYESILPAYLQEAGIDFYFSGHDHSYARTTAMIDGEPDEDGIVYTICGTTGGKGYSVVDTPAFHFEKALTSGEDFNCIYIDLSADEDELTFTAYNVLEDGSTEVLDTYTKEAPEDPYCKNDNHDLIWDQTTDEVTCTKCPFVSTMAEVKWDGFLTDAATGRRMYTTNGEPTTGLFCIANAQGQSVAYYFDSEGLAYEDATYNICGETCKLEGGTITSWENEEIISIGFAGDDIGYVVYADGSMIMRGTGEMWNFDSAGTTPWGAVHEHQIYTVDIGDGITTIGIDAFQLCYDLVSVTTTDSITRIRGNAFYGCSSLESVYISENVTSITGNAFDKPSDTLVLSVGYNSYAKKFAEEHGLNYVERAQIIVPAKKDETYTVNEIKYLVTSASKKTVSVKKPVSSTITAIKIPSAVKINGDSYQVTAIESKAFAACSKLKTISGGSNVTTIKSKAFSGCAKLTTVTGFAHVTTIRKNAFENCVKLNQIGGKEGVVTLKSVQTVGIRAFYGCTSITMVRIPSTELTAIRQAAFRGCTKMTTFRSVSTNLNRIGQKAFYGDKKLATITLKTTRLTQNKVKDKAFTGINSNCKFKVPASKAAAYQKIFLAKGAGAKCKVVKLKN